MEKKTKKHTVGQLLQCDPLFTLNSVYNSPCTCKLNTVLPCTGVMEVCAWRMWFSVMWYAGWCWAISTLVHTLLSPWRKKEKEHDRRSLGTEDRKGWEPTEGRKHGVVQSLFVPLWSRYYFAPFNRMDPLRWLNWDLNGIPITSKDKPRNLW